MYKTKEIIQKERCLLYPGLIPRAIYGLRIRLLLNYWGLPGVDQNPKFINSHVYLWIYNTNVYFCVYMYQAEATLGVNTISKILN